MSIYVFKNGASSTLASSIVAADVTLTVQPGEGALFPTISAGQQAIVTLEDVAGNKEIVHATARSGDVLTVIRAQEGTSAADFASGSRVELRVTAGLLNSLLQKNGGDVLAGTTTVSGVIDLGGGGSVQGGEFTGHVRSAPGVTAGQISVVGGVPKSGSDTILTSANVPSSLPAGVGMVISGMVLMWSGLVGSIPAGYVLCNGSNSTPDLRDKFVIGGGGSLPSTGGAASESTSSNSAGSVTDSHVLSLTEIPSHTHTEDVYPLTAGAGRSAPGVITNGTAALAGTVATNAAGGGLGHTHGLSATAHVHTVATLPPYRALFYIMKT